MDRAPRSVAHRMFRRSDLHASHSHRLAPLAPVAYPRRLRLRLRLLALRLATTATAPPAAASATSPAAAPPPPWSGQAVGALAGSAIAGNSSNTEGAIAGGAIGAMVGNQATKSPREACRY